MSFFSPIGAKEEFDISRAHIITIVTVIIDRIGINSFKIFLNKLDFFNLVKNQFKELPNNIEAEQAVIGSILVSNDIFEDNGTTSIHFSASVLIIKLSPHSD